MGLRGTLKRLARSGVGKALTVGARVALAAKTGGLSEKALSVGKSIGAKIHANRLQKKQGKAVTAALVKLANAPTPGLVHTKGQGGEGWIRQATEGVLQDSVSRVPSRRSRTRNGGSTNLPKPSRRKTPARRRVPPSDAVKESQKAAKAAATARKSRKPPSKATKAKFAFQRDRMKAAGEKWSSMSKEKQKAEGSWRDFLAKFKG